ncbi:MAG: hypothetical protein FJ088_16560, partial [Deltaproteobacteria bacterium]|nr:hypothetical protein [Deltaproteobacteria bacterium]
LRKPCGGDGECSMPAEVCKDDACLADSLVCGKKNAEEGAACTGGICCSGICENLAECP